MNYNLDETFPFDKITLANPSSLQGGGAYFSKIKFEEDDLLIQTPKCLTKNGIHKTGKKIYTDLQLSFDESVFINWIENLEEKIRDLIYEKRNIWFNNEPDKEEIEYNWNSSLRTYKQKYQLLRLYIPKIKISEQQQIQIWDEEQKVLSLDDIQSSNKLINIIEITGLKFTNQSFHLEFLIRQVMVFKEKKIYNKCLISLNNNIEKPQQQLIENTSEDLEKDTNDLAKSKQETEKEREKEMKKETETEKEMEKETETETETEKEMETETEKREEHLEKNKHVIKIQSFMRGFLKRKQLKQEHLEKNNSAKKIQSCIRRFLKQRNKEDKTKDLEKKIEIPIHTKPLEQINEVDIAIPVENEIISLKKPEDVYLNIYKAAKKKAKEAKAIAIKAYLEAKRIKKIYLLDEVDTSGSDTDEEYLS